MEQQNPIKSNETDAMLSAIRFINSTECHVFLTGKAGTGKTTFLRNLAGRTHKHFLVVAPTGIAALNAGGVTIHSQFLFPFGMYLPDSSVHEDDQHGANYFTTSMLTRQHALNSERRQVLRSIDLLVIDEVSMLRADLLDAIDYRLKSARGNFKQSFGGVQLLMIGDLYQLPPVVKREEEARLKRYYPTPWFFEARALKQDGFAYIELDKIFRQRDEAFINVLNNLRTNKPTLADINLLNSFYKPQHEIQKLQEVITLTTHNYKADELNNRALRELHGSSYFMDATIEGEFPEYMFPVAAKLELKVGAQIMFTKNDSEGKKYFNGKLATVTALDNDGVEVSLAGSHEVFHLRHERWENKKYTVNSVTKELEEDVVGSFQQYPVKLAWAITVHKSQGLTFDRAIIDVGQAFADGQVYVALSRLRSLDGLILRTQIDPNVISTDKQVVSFSEQNNHPEALHAIIKKRQIEYIRQLLTRTFDFETFMREVDYIQNTKVDSIDFDNPTEKPFLVRLKEALTKERDNTIKFRNQLLQLLDSAQTQQLLDRIKAGSGYYKTFLTGLIKMALLHIAEMQHRKRVKTYVTSVHELDQMLSRRLAQTEQALLLAQGILENKDEFDFSALDKARLEERNLLLSSISLSSPAAPATKSSKKKAKSKTKNTSESTLNQTLKLLNEGLSLEDVAEKRSLNLSTIESHVAEAIGKGLVDIHRFLPAADLAIIRQAKREIGEGAGHKVVYEKLEGKYSYGKLRMVVEYEKLLTP